MLFGFSITWATFLGIVHSQCYLQEVSNTQANGIKRMDTEIDLHEEILGFLALTSLLRQENFLIQDMYIVTSPNDHMCVFLGHGIRLDDIETSLTNTLNLPLLTQATSYPQPKFC